MVPLVSACPPVAIVVTTDRSRGGCNTEEIIDAASLVVCRSAVALLVLSNSSTNAAE